MRYSCPGVRNYDDCETITMDSTNEFRDLIGLFDEGFASFRFAVPFRRTSLISSFPTQKTGAKNNGRISIL